MKLKEKVADIIVDIICLDAVVEAFWFIIGYVLFGSSPLIGEVMLILLIPGFVGAVLLAKY